MLKEKKVMSDGKLARRVEFVQKEGVFENVFVLHYRSLFNSSLYVLVDGNTGSVVAKFSGLGHFGSNDIKYADWVEMPEYTPQNASVYLTIKKNDYK
jgi:hypothetical protein